MSEATRAQYLADVIALKQAVAILADELRRGEMNELAALIAAKRARKLAKQIERTLGEESRK